MESNQQSEQPPHGIMGLQELSVPWLYYLGLVLVCITLGWLAWLLWRRWLVYKSEQKSARKRGEENLPVDPWLRIHKIFASLQVGESWQQETSEQYFFALSFLLREAMELGSDLPCTSQTLAELDQTLKKNTSLSANFKQDLLEFLTLAERLKFAGQSIQATDAQLWRDKVGLWLERLQRGEG